MFVTTHQLQQQKNKKASQVDKVGNTRMLPRVPIRKSPRLNNLQEVSEEIPTTKAVGAKRKLDLPNHPRDDENMGENDLQVRVSDP